jgi:hypothetical protein
MIKTMSEKLRCSLICGEDACDSRFSVRFETVHLVVVDESGQGKEALVFAPVNAKKRENCERFDCGSTIASVALTESAEVDYVLERVRAEVVSVLPELPPRLC